MKTSNFTIANNENVLINPDYLKDALNSTIECYNAEQLDYILDQTIAINDVSMIKASGYGTWEVRVTLAINGEKKVFTKAHHNEDWYLSQKIAYDASVADSEEDYNEALNNFQLGFESVIDSNVSDIINIIIDKLEEGQ